MGAAALQAPGPDERRGSQSPHHSFSRWLRDIGVAPEELSLETPFKVRIGTNIVEIGGRPRPGVQRARLDILVRRHGVNLLVIEVKEPAARLSKQDREQAISYARLLHPIAPLALVTNGTDFQLFDVLSQDPVTPESTRFNDATTITLPNEARIEALKLFFDLSPENVVSFARAQVARVTNPLLGDPLNYAAVYIRETHVARESLMAAPAPFLAANRPVFVLTGESGMGKTCVMVDLAEQFLSGGYPVLFFRAALLQGSVLDEIAEEVEWAFGGARGSIQTLQRLSDSAAGKPLIVMVDGVEDWALPEKSQHLSWIASHIRSDRVRLIVSCKTRVWRQFTSLRGARTGIEDAVYGAAPQRSFSAELGPFSPKEFFAAVKKHRKTYAIPDEGFDPAALREAQRSPFLLRLMFQVKADEGGSGRMVLNSPALFGRYLHLAAAKTGQEEAAINTLVEIAGILYERDEEWIGEREVRNTLSLRATDILPPGLFEQRLLIAAGEPGRRRIGFALAPLRNYIIAFLARRWPDMQPADFASEFAGAAPQSLRAEALSFYYPLAPDAQKRAVDAPVRENAQAYLRLYTELVDEFPALKDAFAPHTRGRTGFAGELMFPPYIRMHGFRPISDADEEILLIPTDAADEHATRLFVAGVDAPHAYDLRNGFRSPVTAGRIRATEIAYQLEDLIQKGRLNEAAAPDLADELIACALKSQDFLARFLEPRTKRIVYPVDLPDVTAAIEHESLRRHFRDEAVEARRERGEIREEWRGSIASYSAALTPAQEREAAARVEAALRSGTPVKLRAHYTDLERLRTRLGKAIEARRERGSVIVGPVLPLRDQLADCRTASGVPLDAVKEHCRRVLEGAVNSYRGLVETNFPAMIREFGFHRRMPLRFILAIHPEFPSGAGDTVLACVASRTGANEVVIYDRHELSLDLFADTVTIPEGTQDYVSVRWPRFAEFIHGPHVNYLEYDCEEAVLRRWVYKWLQDDFWAVGERLKEELNRKPDT